MRRQVGAAKGAEGGRVSQGWERGLIVGRRGHNSRGLCSGSEQRDDARAGVGAGADGGAASAGAGAAAAAVNDDCGLVVVELHHGRESRPEAEVEAALAMDPRS